MQVSPERLASKLADPKLTASLSHFVRARVPEPEVDDIVQATLADALDAEQHPEQDEEIVRWVHGICRHKVVDWFRRARREVPRDLESAEEGPVPAAAESAPQSAMDLLRWARRELPAGEEHEKTLEWMLREGAGEKLETIAAEANVPAPRVRQRVSRLRRYYKARWAAQAAAVAALLLVALAIALALRPKKEEVAPAPGPSLVPTQEPMAPPTAPPTLPPERPALSTEPPEIAPPEASAAKPPASREVVPTAAPSARAPAPKPVPTTMPSAAPPPLGKAAGKPAPKASKAGPSSIDFGSK